MTRYNSTPTIKNEVTGKRRKATTILPVIPINEADIYIQTTSPDRLDKLANTFYGDVTLWWIIAAANGLGKGTYVVPGNVRLRIPAKINIDDYVIEINRNR
jgi:hypothetical protein